MLKIPIKKQGIYSCLCQTSLGPLVEFKVFFKVMMHVYF